MRSNRLRRREVIAGLGAAAAWPVVAGGQQPATKIVGWLDGGGTKASDERMAAFRAGLSAQSFVEGRNLTMHYRYADGQVARLPALSADLLGRRLDLIVTTGAVTTGTPAIRAINPTVPIVFEGGADPVHGGVVGNLNRPDGNITGVFTADLGSKRLGHLRDLMLQVTTIAVLVNPENAASALEAVEMQNAAGLLGLQIIIANASNEQEVSVAVKSVAQKRAQALLITPNPFFLADARQIIALTERFAIPTFYFDRAFAALGGFISYGASVQEVFRLVGDYAGRILKGSKASDLPIQRPTKYELVINSKTAKSLGISIPPTLLATADEVIE